jgi:hypothetical protein
MEFEIKSYGVLSVASSAILYTYGSSSHAEVPCTSAEVPHSSSTLLEVQQLVFKV